ncbi:MAG: MetQ/NlpA family ABC transporter substrate-binding protein [Coriobacteriales bacterium]|nr:MetQ/NlpA family ABC transporter substrate-binding protein [Coriobacteriales bacterium]
MKGTTRKALSKAVSLALAVLLTLPLLLGLGGCSTKDDNGGGSGSADLVTIKVGASVTPHAEILANLKEDMAAQGFDLQIIEYTDYVKPNMDTDAGDTDANFFQHQPYLDEFNTENGLNLVSVAAVHFEPLGIYAGKTTSLANLPNGASIAVPNDPTNEARALHLLAAQNLITLPAGAGLDITPRDIIDNPKNLKIIEVEAAAVPRQLAEVDLGVINGNVALSAGLDPSKVLVTEDPDSTAAQTYANILVVKAGNENNPAIKALVSLLHSEKTRTFINEKYPGVVIPVF